MLKLEEKRYFEAWGEKIPWSLRRKNREPLKPDFLQLALSSIEKDLKSLIRRFLCSEARTVPLRTVSTSFCLLLRSCKFWDSNYPTKNPALFSPIYLSLSIFIFGEKWCGRPSHHFDLHLLANPKIKITLQKGFFGGQNFHFLFPFLSKPHFWAKKFCLCPLCPLSPCQISEVTLLSDVWSGCAVCCLMSDVWCPMSDVQHCLVWCPIPSWPVTCQTVTYFAPIPCSTHNAHLFKTTLRERKQICNLHEKIYILLKTCSRTSVPEKT